MQLRTVLDVKVVDVEKRRSPSKHYVSHLHPPHLVPLTSVCVSVCVCLSVCLSVCVFVS